MSSSICAAILIAVLSTRSVRADDAKSVPTGDKSKPANAAEAATPTFELKIVGPEGQPIAGAKVNLATTPLLDKIQLHAGKLLNRPRYGVNLQSDAEGRIVVEQPPHLESLNFRIHKPGYSFYSSVYNFHYAGPLTVKLQPAWTIGGIVVDGKGQPVPNARVVLQIRFAGTNQIGPSDRLWTNSKGAWKFESVAESMNVVSAEISEPKYRAINTTLSRAKFRIEPGHEPTEKIVLEKGVTITGKVTDEAGKPIAKALIRARVSNDTRRAFSDKNGVYTLEGCTPDVKLVVTAKGHAAQARDLEIGTMVASVDFQLKPGKTLRLRVLDEAGRPLPKAQVSIWANGSFDSFEADQAPRETDVDGAWVWHDVPSEDVMVTINRPRGMTLNWRRLRAREAEYVFRLGVALVITGRVIDAETKQPLRNFRCTSGVRMNGQQHNWNNNANWARGNGTYQVLQKYEQSAYLVRIEADGHWPSISREIQADEGNVTIDFELLKAKEFAATVLTPDGVPADGAKLAMFRPNDAVSLTRGEFAGSQSDVWEADRTGRVTIGAKRVGLRLVITHPQGYLDLEGLPSANPHLFKLAAWARIEGTVQVGRRPLTDVEVSLNGGTFAQNAPIRNAPPLDRETQMTDSRGRFVFERVIPGLQRITLKRVMGAGKSETSFTANVPVECAAGQTAHVDLGATGRPVIGQLRRPPDFKSDVALSTASIMVLPDSAQYDFETAITFSAKPDDDGNFSLDGLQPGNYVLYGFIQGPLLAQVQGRHFTVPVVNEKLSQRPVDLGVLTLKKVEPMAAPARAKAAK